jgi:TatD DNase family protein
VLIDTHCHLDFPELSANLETVLDRARAAGVGPVITISTRVARFDGLRQIVEAYDGVYCSVGTHPHNAHEELHLTVDDLARLAAHPKVVAIGEVGLDYHYDKSPREAQAECFRLHCAAARATGLPLVVHARQADADVADILEAESGQGTLTGVLHCFTGGAELARRGVDIGFYVSFSGILTFKSAADLRAIAADLPADRILVETDAPYLAPGRYRGQSNEPAFVTETARVLAELRGVPVEELAAQTTRNALTLFRKMAAAEARA